MFNVYHCVNSNTNVDPENGSAPILCICMTIDAILNFDGDVDVDTKADVKCEQSIRVCSH